MAWLQEGIKAGIISIVTAAVIYFWKNARQLYKKAQKIIDSADKLDLLEMEVGVLKSKQMADFHTDVTPVFINNTKGELIYANRAWADLLGWKSVKDAYGKGYLKAVPPQDIEEMERQSQRLVDHPSSFDGEVRLMHRITKEYIYAICRTELIHDNKGNLVETIGRLYVIKQ